MLYFVFIILCIVEVLVKCIILITVCFYTAINYNTKTCDRALDQEDDVKNKSEIGFQLVDPLFGLKS